MYSHPKLNLIGLAAQARAGKSTVAGFLREYRYTEESFAAPIRQFVAGLLGVTLEQLETIKEDRIDWVGKSPRQMMQTLGTEWGRGMVSQTIWVDRVMQSVARLHADNKPVVISDVRFNNEADMIRATGGTVLHIVRPDALRTTAHHISEAGVQRKEGDYQIVNDGTLADLEKKVSEFHYHMWRIHCRDQ